MNRAWQQYVNTIKWSHTYHHQVFKNETPKNLLYCMNLNTFTLLLHGEYIEERNTAIIIIIIIIIKTFIKEINF